MARQKKTSPGEDLVHIISLLPWWMAMALGVIAYFVLHSFATVPDASVPTGAGAMGQVVAGAMKKQAAMIGQYLLPVLCLVAAAISAIRQRKRAGLIKNAASAKGTDGLKNMSWQEFESLVGESFRRDGFSVTETGGDGPDGGIDLVLKKGSDRFLVQCKQWRAVKVGVTVVRELYGVMAAEGAAGGYVVTCGHFTEEAKTFAAGRNVILLDGDALAVMIRQSAGSTENKRKQGPAMVPVLPSAAILCPLCRGAMVERTAKRGPNAGNTFWGCTAYPVCKGTTART